MHWHGLNQNFENSLELHKFFSVPNSSPDSLNHGYYKDFKKVCKNPNSWRPDIIIIIKNFTKFWLNETLKASLFSFSWIPIQAHKHFSPWFKSEINICFSLASH